MWVRRRHADKKKFLIPVKSGRNFTCSFHTLTNQTAEADVQGQDSLYNSNYTPFVSTVFFLLFTLLDNHSQFKFWLRV